jgi:hypothetical protein
MGLLTYEPDLGDMGDLGIAVFHFSDVLVVLVHLALLVHLIFILIFSHFSSK